MPTYHYRCRKCKHEFEEFQSIMDDPLTDCPECQGEIFRVISGGTGMIFKGSGFYITDYRGKKYKSEASREKSDSAASKSSSSSESKTSDKDSASKKPESKPRSN